MTELQLYKFITENDIEWHAGENNGEPDIIIFIYTWDIKEFCTLIENRMDEGIECRLMNGYIAVWMRSVCEYFDINFSNVFKGEES